MDYNKHFVDKILDLEGVIYKSSIPWEAKHKLKSLLGCLEYQVETGDWPDDVVTHLAAAMRAWIDSTPEGKAIVPALDDCIKAISEGDR